MSSVVPGAPGVKIPSILVLNMSCYFVFVSVDDLERSDGEKSEILTEDRLQRLEPTKDNIKKSGYLTDEKLKSIISFLDEVFSLP